MAIMDDFKVALTRLDGTAQVGIQLGRGGQIFQLSAGDLMAALGVRPTVNRTVRVNAFHLNIRSMPGVGGAVIAKLAQGTLVDLIDGVPTQADGHDWLQTADGRGWVAVDLTVAPDAPVTGTPPNSTVIKTPTGSLS